MSLLTPQCDPAFHTLSSKPISTRKETGYSILELAQTEGKKRSGFFIKKKPPFRALKKSICIPKML